MKRKSPPTKKTKTQSTKLKYTESHWLIFGIQGIIALLFGWFIMFSDIAEASTLVQIVGVVLLSMGLIEVANLINRHRNKRGRKLSFTIAFINIAVAIALLATRDVPIAVHLSIVAGYTLLRGLFDTIIAIRSIKDTTDKFLWIITGMFGMILGFVILNSGNIDLANTTFIKIFGTYLMVFGLANIFFSIHSKNTNSVK